MSLFIVVAKHSPESCPAGNPEMGKMLLSHIHNDSASKFGIKIQASAGAESQHTLHMIMDGENAMVWRVIAMPSPGNQHLKLKFSLFRDWIDDTGALDCLDGQGRALFESVRTDAIAI